MTTLSLHSIQVTLGDTEVLSGVDLVVESGSTMALLGASGSGKTTLLRTVVGLQRPTSGRVMLDSTEVTGLATRDRGISLVPQNPALIPRLTVADNVEQPLTYTSDEPSERRRNRVYRELRRFGIGRLRNRRPPETSSGERQAAATARGTVGSPSVLLLDEPVIAIDPAARRSMIGQIRDRQRRDGMTMLVATNDWGVAAGLADRIAVLIDGTIVQTDTAPELYDRPTTLEVAALTGTWELNRLAGRLRRHRDLQHEIITPAGTLRTWRDLADTAMIVGLRPEDLEVVATDGGETAVDADGGLLEAVVTSSAALGRTTLVGLDGNGIPLQAMSPTPGPEIGTTVRLRWRVAHLFDLNGDALDHLD